MPTQPTTADQALVRKLNLSLIVDCLRTHDSPARTNLSAAVGLDRITGDVDLSVHLDQETAQQLLKADHSPPLVRASGRLPT